MTLFEQTLEPENLKAAWKRVKANKGAPGIDEMTIEDFPQFFCKHGETIKGKLLAGTYRPSPVKRVEIPKPDKTKRRLGIPTVLDRVIQQAIKQILTPIFDPDFSDRSHGYRPAHSAAGAIEQWHQQSQSHRKGRRECYVVDCDLKAFFDTVDHGELMTRLRRKIDDERLLDLIYHYLKAGVIELDGTRNKSPLGVPQGGPLSPLLANILLDDLDKELTTRGHSFVRYADDFVIQCGSLRAGNRILASISCYLRDQLKLIVNTAKSQVVKISQASFLGFTVQKHKVRWSPKAKRKFKTSVRTITRRTRGVSATKVISDLNHYVRGAINYYMPGLNFAEARELDQWLRRRMRLYYWKQWKRPRTRRRNLLRLGIGRDEVHRASRARKGPWRMSQNSIVTRAMTNQWLADQGVPSIEKQWISIRYPNGPKPQVKKPQGRHAQAKAKGDLKA